MPDNKLYVFVNVFELTDAERAANKAKLRKNHAAALFVYASGVINPDREKRFSADNIADLTGFAMVMDPEERSPKFRILPHDITAGMQNRFIYGWQDRRRLQALGENADVKTYLWPAFYPTDGEAAAKFLTFDAPALSVKEADGYTSIYHGAKMVRSDTLRSIAAWAGCHIYCDSDDVTYIGGQYITIHASSKGAKTLRFPKPVTLMEVYENRIYAENITELTLDMYLGETKMFRMT